MRFNIFTAISAWLFLILLIITVIVSVGLRKISKIPHKSNTFPAEIQPIINDLTWYFTNCIEGKQIDVATSSAFDNISEFYVKRFSKLSESDQIKFFRILFTYQTEINDYVRQIHDDMDGIGNYQNDAWYLAMSKLFIDVYSDTLKIAFKDVIADHLEEFNQLDFVGYQTAISQINLWDKQSNFEYKKQLGDY